MIVLGNVILILSFVLPCTRYTCYTSYRGNVWTNAVIHPNRIRMREAARAGDRIRETSSLQSINY